MRFSTDRYLCLRPVDLNGHGKQMPTPCPFTLAANRPRRHSVDALVYFLVASSGFSQSCNSVRRVETLRPCDWPGEAEDTPRLGRAGSSAALTGLTAPLQGHTPLHS